MKRNQTLHTKLWKDLGAVFPPARMTGSLKLPVEMWKSLHRLSTLEANLSLHKKKMKLVELEMAAIEGQIRAEIEKHSSNGSH